MTRGETVRFVVVGAPKTKGSPNGYPYRGKDGRLHVRISHGKSAQEWERVIRMAAGTRMQEIGGHPFEGPILLAATFYLPAPKALLPRLRRGVTVPHVKKPDLDKLTRCLKDALSKVVWRDDSQVIALRPITKVYATPNELPRVEVEVTQVG